MSALVSGSNPDNANPTIHKSSTEKRSRLGDFLDAEDDGSDFEELDSSDDGGMEFSSGSENGSEKAARRGGEAEPIDADEVFGKRQC